MQCLVRDEKGCTRGVQTRGIASSAGTLCAVVQRMPVAQQTQKSTDAVEETRRGFTLDTTPNFLGRRSTERTWVSSRYLNCHAKARSQPAVELVQSQDSPPSTSSNKCGRLAKATVLVSYLYDAPSSHSPAVCLHGSGDVGSPIRIRPSIS